MEKILNSDFRECRLDIVNADVNIYSSNIPHPIIKYNGSFDIRDNDSILKIKQIFEKKKKGFSFSRLFGKKVITMNGCEIIKRGNNITVLGNGANTIVQINGRTFVNDIEITDDMFEGTNNFNSREEVVDDSCVDLILPSGRSDISLDLNLTSGDINLRNLILNRLIINSKNGDINLQDIDAVMSKIELIRGDIKVEIAESMVNYILSSNTKKGSSSQRTVEIFEAMPTLLASKHMLDINSKNGDIDVVFKGKCKQR